MHGCDTTRRDVGDAEEDAVGRAFGECRGQGGRRGGVGDWHAEARVEAGEAGALGPEGEERCDYCVGDDDGFAVGRVGGCDEPWGAKLSGVGCRGGHFVAWFGEGESEDWEYE